MTPKKVVYESEEDIGQMITKGHPPDSVYSVVDLWTAVLNISLKILMEIKYVGFFIINHRFVCGREVKDVFLR